MAQISGRTVLGLFRFVKEENYPGGIPGFLGTVPPASRGHFEHRIRTGDWLPYGAYVAMLEAIAAHHEDGVRALAGVGLRRDVSTVLKILKVFSSVDALVTRGFGSWGSFLWSRHCDGGTVFLADQGPQTATMGLKDFPDIVPIHCTLVSAYLEAMGRAVGAKQLVMKHDVCVHRGDAHCEFRGEW